VKDMPQPLPHLPSQQDALALHQRLLTHHPTASDELASAYLEPLVVWLAEVAPRVDPEMRQDAAGDAILALIRNPESYSPGLQTLEAYLRMSAHGDMLNALAKEKRRKKHEVPCENVELLSDGGKYVGHDNDPGLALRIAEEGQSALRTIPESVRQRLSETDLQLQDQSE
jgi:DNA-directed RNA polymerase specialized sigma24 family protein